MEQGKATRRILAFILATVLTMGMVQTAFATPTPVAATIYIDGQATTLGDTLHTLDGFHFVDSEAFAKAMGFEITNVRDDRTWISFLVSNDWGDPSIYGTNVVRIELFMGLGFTPLGATGAGVQTGTVEIFNGEEAREPASFIIMIDDWSTIVGIENPQPIDLTQPSIVSVGEQLLVSLELVCFLLDHTLTVDGNVIRIDTANSYLGVRPNLSAGTPTPPQPPSPPTITPELPPLPPAPERPTPPPMPLPPAGQTAILLTIGNAVYSVNGVQHTADEAPFIADGRTMVPIRLVSEALGAEVGWDGDTRTVTIVSGATNLSLVLDVPLPNNMGTPTLHGGRTFVPVAFVAESLGATVSWDGATQTVTITQ
ncbi:MAG: copper amine oxidase N-terminal domain-containing protein [Defluviitaleaceae bacterium]|nr:copper amine oxidase N-terminal domain-containing protein [Defluviitaleaceae bacterium]MCL2263376.1 copper amine oxidase N-terminal domain-containing protein [Defluviitaleaceae bacterium]